MTPNSSLNTPGYSKGRKKRRKKEKKGNTAATDRILATV
jgi:hypothetical protein